ncbi:MAG: Na+/H+ antiporter NhaC [Fretibacterium sp.]|nr:Na+/H+ antiporter NhaC [Fretibacterium sp.]
MALIVLLVCAFIVSFGVVSVQLESGFKIGLGLPAQVPLFFATVFAALVGFFALKVPWPDLERGICSAIQVSIQAILILILVGCLVGSWIHSGVVATMIYYGLEVMSPRFFYAATLLICCVVSLATGCCWTTSSTVGVALIGISAGLELPLPVTAGFIISGAYFGDKMSPLSDTTNLAPAVAGSELFDHVRAMIGSTLPTLGLVAVISLMMGSSSDMDVSRITLIQEMMSAEFPISFWGFIPPAIILLMAFLKAPAIPSIVAGLFGGIALSLFQGGPAQDALTVLFSGYVPERLGDFAKATPQVLSSFGAGAGVSLEAFTEVGALLEELFTRGGMVSMLETISLIVMALSLGGVMEVCAFLDVLLEALLERVKTVFGLVASVLASCFIANVFLSDQYLAIIVPGRMFRRAFDDQTWNGRKLAPTMLSRSLEDSGTMTSVLVPWNTCGVYISTVLGVPTLAYLPYCFLNYLNPLVALVMTWFGLGILWRPDEEPELFPAAAD